MDRSRLILQLQAHMSKTNKKLIDHKVEYQTHICLDIFYNELIFGHLKK
jgi:hypothetical protein